MINQKAARYPNSTPSANRPNQFCCKSAPHYCIDWWHVCDHVYDCFDRSDEMDCPSVSNTRNRTKKDDIAANKLAKLIGLLKQN